MAAGGRSWELLMLVAAVSSLLSGSMELDAMLLATSAVLVSMNQSRREDSMDSENGNEAEAEENRKDAVGGQRSKEIEEKVFVGKAAATVGNRNSSCQITT